MPTTIRKPFLCHRLAPAALAAAFLLAATASVRLAAQAPVPPRLSFDVASIKPSPALATLMASHTTPHVGTHIDAGRVDIGFASLQQLICVAYNVKPYQVTGPDWLTSTRFDIQATLPQGASPDQLPAMLQSLLADRFGLTLHHSVQQLPVYSLVVGKDGPRLAPASPVPAPGTPPPPAPKGATTIATGRGGTATMTRGRNGSASVDVRGGPNGASHIVMTSEGMSLQADRMTMSNLADTITPMLDRPVLDNTGLKGPYTITLAISRDDLMAVARAQAAKLGLPAAMMGPAAGGGAPAPSGRSIFASVQKLGLKLEPVQAPVDCLVVDHINKTPTAN